MVKSEFLKFEKRLELLYVLKNNGFYVRMHAYEYIVGYGDRLGCIIILEPSKNLVEIIKLPYSRLNEKQIEHLIRLIKSIDKNVVVKLR